MIGKDKKKKVKKGQERERKRNTDDRDVCNIEEKEVPGAVLISLHMFYSTYSTAVLVLQIRIWDLDFVLVNRQKEP